MSPSSPRHRVSPITVEPPPVPVSCGRPRSMADRKHEQPVGRPHPWSPATGPTSPTFASTNMDSALKVSSRNTPMQSTYGASYKPRSRAGQERSVTAARVRNPLDSCVMDSLLKLSTTKQLDKVEWKAQARKKVDHLEQSPEIAFLGRKQVPQPSSGAEYAYRGKALLQGRATNQTTSHESPMGPEWKSLRRVPPTVLSDAQNAITYVPPPQPTARFPEPTHHLAVSRPLWDPEVSVKPRAVVPEHLRPSSVLRAGELEREPVRRKSISKPSYNPITHECTDSSSSTTTSAVSGRSSTSIRSRPGQQHTPLW